METVNLRWHWSNDEYARTEYGDYTAYIQRCWTIGKGEEASWLSVVNEKASGKIIEHNYGADPLEALMQTRMAIQNAIARKNAGLAPDVLAALKQEQIDRPYTKRLTWIWGDGGFQTNTGDFVGYIEQRSTGDWVFEVRDAARGVRVAWGFEDRKARAMGMAEAEIALNREAIAEKLRKAAADALRDRAAKFTEMHEHAEAKAEPKPAAPSAEHHKPVAVADIKAALVGYDGLREHFGFHLLENGNILFDPLFVAAEAIRLAKKGGLR